MVTNRVRSWLALLAVAPLITLGACSSSNSGDAKKSDAAGKSPAKVLEVKQEDPNDVCTKAQEGGSLIYRTTIEGAGFDPVVQSANVNVALAIYGTLLIYNNITSKFEGDVAESMTGNADSTVWTLKLRPNVVYPDGKPLDSAVVKQNIERYLDPSTPSAYTAQVAEIDRMDTPDAQTVVFTLKSAWGTFPWLLTQNPGMIINPAVLASTSAKILQSNPPVNAGAGAFTLKTYARGQSATLGGKKDWWGGPVCLDELTINFGTDDTDADYQLMQSGGADVIDSYDPVAVAKTVSDKSVSRYAMPGAVVSPVLMNTSHAPFSDLRMRLAVQQAMDRNLINDRNYDGLALPEAGIVPSTFPLQPTVKPVGYDAAAASAEAKAAIGDGISAKFSYTVNDTASNENLAILQQALAKKAGLNMELDNLQVNEWLNKVYVTRGFDSAQGGFIPNPSCVYCTYDVFLSTNAAGNVTGFKSPDMDKALGELKAASTSEATEAGLNALQEAWNKDMPAAMTIWLPYYMIAKNDVHGFRFSSSVYPVHWDKAYIAK